MSNHNFFLLQQTVDTAFDNNSSVDHDEISKDFHSTLENNLSDDDFVDLLIYVGYIPDLYEADSSQETLFSKLVEVVVCEWAGRMGFESHCIKQKSSFEDVNITINNKVVVCDAKSFRLGRSQKAPNVKDFLKLEDIRNWLKRHSNPLGGLVTYPCTHEWSSSSDVYQHCSNKKTPTIMLPYKYLSYLLKNKNKFNTSSLSSLWDYDRIFPTDLSKEMEGGNRAAYWAEIDAEIVKITKTSKFDLQDYISNADKIIYECIQANLLILEQKESDIIQEIEAAVNAENDLSKLKQEMISYRINAETGTLNDLIRRIEDYRLKYYQP